MGSGCFSNPVIGKLSYRTFVKCQLYWKDENKEKEAGNGAFKKPFNWFKMFYFCSVTFRFSRFPPKKVIQYWPPVQYFIWKSASRYGDNMKVHSDSFLSLQFNFWYLLSNTQMSFVGASVTHPFQSNQQVCCHCNS